MTFITNIKDWSKIRRRILERDGFICRICGECDNLNVHHIDYHRGNNANSNLVSLCTTCHRAVHAEGYKPSEHEDHPVPWDNVLDD